MKNKKTVSYQKLNKNFIDYALEHKQEWKKSQSRFTDAELLRIFPEAKDVFPSKIEEWEEAREKLVDAISQKLLLVSEVCLNEFSKWFWREWVKVNEGQELIRIDGHISRLKRLGLIASGKKLKVGVTAGQIDLAVNIPIETVAGTFIKTLSKTSDKLVGLCPLHAESTPSFTIYLKTNSFYCFGCAEGGNTIKFIRAMYGYNFVEAVNFLIGGGK